MNNGSSVSFSNFSSYNASSNALGTDTGMVEVEAKERRKEHHGKPKRLA
jgi:hypothetical protein